MPTKKSIVKLTKHQAGLLLVVVEDFSHHRFPRLQTLKAKVDNGEIFSEVDIEFMQESIDSALRTLPMTIHHKELQEFCSHVASLYNELTRKALDNEIRTNS